MPFSKSDFAIIAATERGGRAAFLLRAVDRVRKAIVGGDVIELRGGLVVPRAPGGATVDCDDRALVGGERNDLGIFGIDPDALVIVAARRAFHHREAFPSVARTIQRRVWYIHGVSVFWVDTHFAEIP